MRVTKAEMEALRAAEEYFRAEGLPLAEGLAKLLRRIEGRPESESSGPSIADIEGCLVACSGGKVVPVHTPDRRFWIIEQNAWKGTGVTLESVEKVARWLRGNTWMQGPYTVRDVRFKWPVWLTKAESTQVQAQEERHEFEGE
jgi:hypothetical protein